MISKKINLLLCSILGVALTIGIMNTPVFATDNAQASSSYSTSTNANSTENNTYIVSKDNSIEKNGLKISIDEIVATKHNLKATIKIESQKAFDKNEDNDIKALLTYGDVKENSSGESYGTTDDKTIKITLEKEVDKGDLPEKGDLRIDLVIPKYKINVGMDANVDFSESFKNTIEKDVDIKVPEFNFTIKKIESNVLGTEITYDKQRSTNINDKRDFSIDFHNPFILKVGDRMYQTMFDGSHSSSDTNMISGTYKADAATYDKVKNQNSISIIPINCNISSDERSNFYKDNYKNEKKTESQKETLNNVTYTKNFDFADGTKGEIYNIERNDTSVKVYCKGATEKESLLMAATAEIYYKYDKDQIDYSDDYISTENMSFYKDPKDPLGYVIEFNNVKKDKTMEFSFDELIKLVDKFTFGNEVQLFK
jgi:hypothetical protein